MTRRAAAVLFSLLLIAAVAAAPAPEVKHKTVEPDALPGKLKEAVAKNKGSDEVTEVVEITRGARTVYRIRLENAALKQAKFIVLGPTGDLLRELDLTKPGAAVVKWENLPGDVKSAFAKKAPAEQYQQFTRINRNATIFYVGVLAKGGEAIRVDEAGNFIAEEPPAPAESPADRYTRKELTYDNLPGPVKGAIGQSGGKPDSVTEAFQISRGDETFYRVTLKANNNRLRLLRISPDGKVESERNATPEGKVKVPTDSLSGTVKTAVYRESNGRPPAEVLQVTEDGNTWYVVEQGDQKIAIDDAGQRLEPAQKNGR